MPVIFIALTLFSAVPTLASEQKILVLGEEWIIDGQKRLWIEAAGGLSAQPRGHGIVMKGKKESVTDIRIGDREITVHVVTRAAAATAKVLSEKTSRLVGLTMSWNGSVPIIEGRLHRLEDFTSLVKSLPTDAVWEFHAEVPKRLRASFEDSLITQLGPGAPVRPLAFEDVPTALFNGPTEAAKRWESRLQRWGLRLRREEAAVEMAPVVRVEIAVAELRRDRVKNIGLKWPQSFNAQTLDGAWSATTPFSAEVFESQGYGRVLARPNVLCRSGKEAEFVAGGEFPIKIFNYRQQDVVWKRYGIVLKVKPKADASGRISLALETEVSTIDPAHTVDGIPGVLTNKVASHFDLTRPRTIVLSGLLKNEDSIHREGVPGLSGLPILGPLFGSKDWKENRTELVIFVRPSIVTEEEP